MESPNVEKISPEILNAALSLSMEWGENLFKPINDRIRQKFPSISAEQANELNGWCEEVKNFAFACIAKQYPDGICAMPEVQAKYPQLDETSLTYLLNQGMYYAWHG